MSRPKCCRRVGAEPTRKVFKPVGVPVASLEEIVLSMDEFEAIRLADLNGLYHEQAAGRMNISRQTFGRVIEVARGKVATVLVKGLALRIEGGEIEMAEMRNFRCQECQHVWDVPYGTGRPAECPACKSKKLQRSEGQRGAGRNRGSCERTRCRRS